MWWSSEVKCSSNGWSRSSSAKCCLGSWKLSNSFENKRSLGKNRKKLLVLGSLLSPMQFQGIHPKHSGWSTARRMLVSFWINLSQLRRGSWKTIPYTRNYCRKVLYTGDIRAMRDFASEENLSQNSATYLSKGCALPLREAVGQNT